MIISKNIYNKNHAAKLILFNEKEYEKDSNDFDNIKSTLKVLYSLLENLVTTHQNVFPIKWHTFSEALIVASTNPQYDKRLFCPCSVLVVFMLTPWTIRCQIDAKIRASDKDLPVPKYIFFLLFSYWLGHDFRSIWHSRSGYRRICKILSTISIQIYLFDCNSGKSEIMTDYFMHYTLTQSMDQYTY